MVWGQCTVYASTKDQSNGTQRVNIQGQNLHTKDQSYGSMGTQSCTKEQSLGHEVPVCTEDEPYGDRMHK